jgi:hypothetical protein
LVPRFSGKKVYQQAADQNKKQQNRGRFVGSFVLPLAALSRGRDTRFDPMQNVLNDDRYHR